VRPLVLLTSAMEFVWGGLPATGTRPETKAGHTLSCKLKIFGCRLFAPLMFR
jgi:hypothetical protein